MEKTISMAQLAKNIDRVAKDLEIEGTVYRIKRPGHRAMVLMDDEFYERWLATYEFLLQHPNWREEIAEGRRQYEAGLCRTLEDVVKELGLEGAASHRKRRSAARGHAGARGRNRR